MTNFLCIQNIFSHFIKIYLSKLHAIVYKDTDLDPDLDTTHGSRSSPIPKIVRRSTPLIISILRSAHCYETTCVHVDVREVS